MESNSIEIQFIEVSWTLKIRNEKDSVCWFTLKKVESMKVNGMLTRGMVEATNFLHLETFFKVITKRANPMEKAFIHGLMERSTMVNGQEA